MKNSEHDLRKRIKELEQQVAELKQSYSLYKTIIEQLPVGIHVFDHEGYSFFINEAAKDLSAFTDEKQTPESFNTLTDSSSESEGTDQFYQRVYRGETCSRQYTINPTSDKKHKNKTNGLRTIQETIFPIKGNNENPGFVVSLKEDKTQDTHKGDIDTTNQDKYKILYEQLRITLESIGDAVISTDTKGQIVWMNPIAQKLTGWHQQEAKEKPLAEVFRIINAKSKEKVENPVDKVLNTGKIVGLANHTKLLAKDGNEYHISDSAAPIKDEEGEIHGAVAVFKDITEEYKKNQQLKHSRDFLNAIFQSIQDGISVLNPDLTIRYVNPVMEKWYEENVPLVGKKCYECYHNTNEACDPCPTLRAMETKQTEHNIVKGSPSPDSPVKWLELYSYPIIDSETNQVTGVVEFVRNITERVNNREELVSQKNRLENIIEGTNAGTWEWNVQTGETIFNERWAEIIGYTLDEISPVSIETWVKYAHPDDLRKSNELLEKHLNGEIEHYTCECRMKHKDGHWVWVLDKGKVISWTEDGRPLWVFGTHQDITERKNREARIQALKEDLEAAEEEIRASNEELRDKNKKLEKQKEELQQAFDKLEESETRFKNLFHDNLAPMLVLEPETRKIIEANKAAVKFYGWDMETLLTMKIDDINILPPDKLEKTMKDIIKEDGKVYYQFQHKLANGNIRDVEVYSSKIRHKGQPYYCALIHDITERKIAEKKLQKRTEEYYTLYKEYKTQNENLLEAKERAEESDRLKSAFLANMSHEIRTPMNGIMGFSKMMQETEFPEEKQKKFLDIIHSRTQHLLQIINDIVDISKIEAHQLSIYPQKFSLNELIKELENFYKKDLHDKGKHNLQLNTNIGLSEEESIIESDPTRIRQVLDNLFSNAIKFTEEGSIVLGYSLRSDESLLFWVKDSGIGIAEKDQGKIFERFRQVHDSNNRLYEGTGLGLSISKKLTELLGGKMWVESKVNEGSVFYFTVPYVNKERATTKATASKSENPDWRGNTLLIVEDDPTSLEYLKEITKPTGARIILKETGEDGYNAYKNDPSVDIILMDLRLPDINGLEIIKRIREKDRDVKIVAQTAHAMGGDKRKCHESGADDYISKPIDASDLITVIDRFVQ